VKFRGNAPIIDIADRRVKIWSAKSGATVSDSSNYVKNNYLYKFQVEWIGVP